MATIERPAAPAPPETPRVPKPSRPVVKPPKPFFLRSWFALVITAVLVAAHIYGYQVSQIEPGLLVQKWPDMQRRFGELLQPEIVVRDQKQLQVPLPIVGVETASTNPTPATIEAPTDTVINLGGDVEVRVAEGEQIETFNVKVEASKGEVAPGETMTVSGSGLRPNTPGRVLWQSTGLNASTQPIGTFTADAQGNFTTEVTVPGDADRVLNSFGFPNTLTVSQTWDFGNVYASETLTLVIEKMVETIFLALMGTTFAIVLSLPLSFLAARNLMPHTFLGNATYFVTRTLLNVLRSIEVLILAVIFAATVGLGPFAGVLALTVHSIASLGKLYSEAIESIDPGPLEAITATGANRLQVIMYAVVPQFIPQFLSFTLYRWDINVRMSTVIGFVGGGGVGYILLQFINLGNYFRAATAIWAIAIVVMAMDWASAKLRERII
ncbi:MAG TPA: phosphonate ABC transporter, permease protein PhnE [Chloroflexia bacterium]|nr:phosphonate ABC transporter, permease protein PhnE [Chloroflexia bacterium]